MKGPGREMVIEGVSLIVCLTCASRIRTKTLGADSPRPIERSSFRRVAARPRQSVRPSPSIRPRPRSRPRPRPATLDDMVLIENYADVIRRARQAAKMTQEELAQRIGEKYSTLQAIEAGRLKPTKKAIRGLERELHISLLEPVAAVPVKTSREIESHGPTLGDVVRVKRKKRS